MKYHLTLRDNESGEIIKDLDVYGLIGVYGYNSKLVPDEAYSGQLCYCEAEPINQFVLFCVLQSMIRELEQLPLVKDLWKETGAKDPDFLERMFAECMQEVNDEFACPQA